jgi:hypothetical protein
VLFAELAGRIHVVVSQSPAKGRRIEPPVKVYLTSSYLGEDVYYLFDFEGPKFVDNVFYRSQYVFLTGERVVYFDRLRQSYDFATQKGPKEFRTFRVRP